MTDDELAALGRAQSALANFGSSLEITGTAMHRAAQAMRHIGHSPMLGDIVLGEAMTVNEYLEQLSTEDVVQLLASWPEENRLRCVTLARTRLHDSVECGSTISFTRLEVAQFLLARLRRYNQERNDRYRMVFGAGAAPIDIFQHPEPPAWADALLSDRKVKKKKIVSAEKKIALRKTRRLRIRKNEDD